MVLLLVFIIYFYLKNTSFFSDSFLVPLTPLTTWMGILGQKMTWTCYFTLGDKIFFRQKKRLKPWYLNAHGQNSIPFGLSTWKRESVNRLNTEVKVSVISVHHFSLGDVHWLVQSETFTWKSLSDRTWIASTTWNSLW